MIDGFIKIGIIGFGRMGITHYSIINSHPKVKIIAIADTSDTVLKLLKRNISEINVYSSYITLLEEEELNAVLVCTPPNLHYPIIKICAYKGIHVFVEKPFTTQYTMAIELAQIFSKKNLINQVGYVNRYNDIFSKARFFLEHSLVGNIVRFRSEMFSSTIIEPEKSTSWRSVRESGGGVVFEIAAHSIDLVNYLIGKPDKIIGSSLNIIFSKNIEDAVSSTLLYKNGINGTIYANWSDESYRKPINKIEIFGKLGKILADQFSLKIFMKYPNREFKLHKGWNTLYITDVFKPVPFYVRGNEFTRQLYSFIECIVSGDNTNLCSFEEASKTLNVIEEIFKDFNNTSSL